jgi:predicted adenylyl cyclase CyaB
MFEAEIKLSITDENAIRAALDSQARSKDEVYIDYYFTHPDLVPPNAERELRVREIRWSEGSRSLLTFKDKVVDLATRSKREYELKVADAAELRRMLVAMGFNIDIDLTKNCTNWKLSHGRHEILATLVSVPELPDHYLELETLIGEETEVQAGINELRIFASQLNLAKHDETTASYTDSARSARAARIND